MADTHASSKRFFAPAKINLFLHITGKRRDGYHELDSLVCFADIGDYVTLSPSKAPGFEVSGPFASGFDTHELDSSPNSKNIVMKALWGLSRLYKRAPEFYVHLEKNLPLAAGIGGGSADAAALIWGVVQEWGKPDDQDAFEAFMLELGADVPVCYTCDNTFVRGIGEDITRLSDFAEIPVLLINPLKSCPTASVFKSFSGTYKDKMNISSIPNLDELIDFIKIKSNDLEKPACSIVEDITNVLNSLRYAHGCQLARMSGSGATCFGLFDNAEDSHKAAQLIQAENPDWWIKSGILGGSARY